MTFRVATCNWCFVLQFVTGVEMLCYSLLLMFQVAAGQLVCYITTCNWCFVLQFVIDVSVCNLLIGVLQFVTVCDWCFACKISTVLHTARV